MSHITLSAHEARTLLANGELFKTWPMDYRGDWGPIKDAEYNKLSGSWVFRVRDDRLMAYSAPIRPGEAWGRETHSVECCREVGWYDPPHPEATHPLIVTDDPNCGRYWEQAHYRATDPPPELVSMDGDNKPSPNWRSPVTMPRALCRPEFRTITITDVAPFKVANITEEQAKLSGAPCRRWRIVPGGEGHSPIDGPCYRNGFANMWRADNPGRDPETSWEWGAWLTIERGEQQ